MYLYAHASFQTTDLGLPHGWAPMAARHRLQHRDWVLTVCTYIYMKNLLWFSFSASFFDEAKRWFEAATVICRFIPGGQERADKASL